MTESELTAHLKAVIDAIPEKSVSARQAAYCVLEEIERMRAELARLSAWASREASRQAVMRELGVQLKNAATRLEGLDAVAKLEAAGVEVVQEPGRPTLVPCRLVPSPDGAA